MTNPGDHPEEDSTSNLRSTQIGPESREVCRAARDRLTVHITPPLSETQAKKLTHIFYGSMFKKPTLFLAECGKLITLPPKQCIHAIQQTTKVEMSLLRKNKMAKTLNQVAKTLKQKKNKKNTNKQTPPPPPHKPRHQHSSGHSTPPHSPYLTQTTHNII